MVGEDGDALNVLLNDFASILSSVPIEIGDVGHGAPPISRHAAM
jgi:hypothetical protein